MTSNDTACHSSWSVGLPTWGTQKNILRLLIGSVGIVLSILFTTQRIAPVQADALDPQIIGGQEADPHAWPWQVALVNPELAADGPNFHQAHFCGGSILHQEWVLTAAHCVTLAQSTTVMPLDQVSIVAGIHDLRTPEVGYQWISAGQIIVHENYDPVSLDNDVALIKLDVPIQPAPTAYRVTLIEPFGSSPDGTASTLIGWGNRNAGGEPDYPGRLHQVELPVLNNGVCEAMFDAALGDSDWISENMICFGLAEGGKGTCQGDSGSSAVVWDGEIWKQIGVSSFVGSTCAEVNQPSAFARVVNYIYWIEQRTGFLSPKPNSEQWTVDPTSAGDQFINTDDRQVVINMPAGSLPENAVLLTYTPDTAPIAEVPGAFVGPAFDITLFDQFTDVVIGPNWDPAFTIEIRYDGKKLPLAVAEDDLEVLRWDTSLDQWVSIQVAYRDTESDVLVIEADQSGEYAVAAPDMAIDSLYLPLISN